MLSNNFNKAESFGFSPDANGIENRKALQRAVDNGGTITVADPGTYEISGTVYIGDNTSLVFGNGVFIKKTAENGSFTHVFLNKGALSKAVNHSITIEGLNLIVNGVDKAFDEIYGLRGQIAFYHVRDLKIDRFRCLDLAKAQFAIHVCSFEDIAINDVIIKGHKDGVHLGRGKRFRITNGTFSTVDDAIALNAHDYASSNPELGWIEDGLIQNCHDLYSGDSILGFFCRILAGGWLDWKPGLEVRNSDSVVSNGRVYRVQAKPDGKTYVSKTKPEHLQGNEIIDGINWGLVQDEAVYTSGVCNVTFRDIFLHKPRTSFSAHFDNDNYSRSYYPGAEIPQQGMLLFDNIRIMHEEKANLFEIATPLEVLRINNSCIGNNQIRFHGNIADFNHGKTTVSFTNCVFGADDDFTIINNEIDGKEIELKTSGSIVTGKDLTITTKSVSDSITINSDLSIESGK